MVKPGDPNAEFLAIRMAAGPDQEILESDTSDTFFAGIRAYERDYRNSSLRSNVLVTSTNTGDYHASAGFIATCR